VNLIGSLVMLAGLIACSASCQRDGPSGRIGEPEPTRRVTNRWLQTPVATIELRDLYLHAKPTDDFPDSIKAALLRSEFREALEKEMASIEPGDVMRSSIAYCLAMTGQDADRYVSVLLESVQRWKDGFIAKTFEEDAVSALPEALDRLWRDKLSNRALEAIVTLSLDGGPAETIDVIRLGILRDSPEELMRAVYLVAHGDISVATARKGGSSLLQSLRFRLSDRFRNPAAYEAEMRSISFLEALATKRSDDFGQFVLKAIAYLRKPWPKDGEGGDES
jgi:hypothetical protein